MTARRAATIVVVVLLALAGRGHLRAQAPQADGLGPFLQRLERILLTGDTRSFLALTAGAGDAKRARDFAQFEIFGGATRAVVRLRDRAESDGAPPGTAYRLHLDLFVEFGDRARAASWRLDVRRVDGEWRLADQQRITSTENLYRLSLNAAKQYDAKDLVITAEDMDLRLISGTVFVSEIDQGITGLVLTGSGQMRFHPRPDTERGQVRIFCGSEVLDTRFDAAFIRINPSEFELRVDSSRLVPRSVDQRDFRRANEVFAAEAPNSFGLDLGDLSGENWSLLPPFGDVLAEIHTRKFDTLTYARAAAEPEDITLFDRRRRHNIALYPSQEKLAARGRFYNEDDLADFDVTAYDLDLTVSPDRAWIQGRATLRLTVTAPSLNALNFRLADSLAIQSLVSTRFGRLFPIRVRNQNTVVVNLPGTVLRDDVLVVTIVYGGRVESQVQDSESLQFGLPTAQDDLPKILPEANFLYSNRVYWYPQGQNSGYANARIRLTVPAALDCIASGDAVPGYPVAANGATDPAKAQKVYLFVATQPVRYLAFVLSRFVRIDPVTVAVPKPLQPFDNGDETLAGVSYDKLEVAVAANPREAQRGRQILDRAGDVARFYASLVGDAPYPSFTLAVVENNLPGGHSPGYFAVLNQPLPTTPFTWRNDPASFQSYPDFFLAHELAHQWWGQAVGWRNYHEQWLSEGFAQFFAALYAERHRGPAVFADIMRQARRWTFDERDQGPIYLGYRLGHIRANSRVFRALVYDKSAAVLQMLRLQLGDAAFFRGIQRFYRTSRFQKVGTEDLRAIMERESGRPLARFFEGWIYGSGIPRLKFSYRVVPGASESEVALHIEQIGELFDVPVPVTLELSDGKPIEVVVKVTDRTADLRVPFAGRLRGVDVRDDAGMLAEIIR